MRSMSTNKNVNVLTTMLVIVVVAALAIVSASWIATSATIVAHAKLLPSSSTTSATTTITSTTPFSTSAHVKGAQSLLHSAKRTAWQQWHSTSSARAHHSRAQTAAFRTPSASPDWKACATCMAPVTTHIVNATLDAVTAMCASNTTNPNIVGLCGMIAEFGPLWMSYTVAHLTPAFDAYLYCAGSGQCTQFPVDLPAVVPYMPDPVSMLYTQLNIVTDIVMPSVVGFSELVPALPNDTYVDPDGSFPYPYLFAKEPSSEGVDVATDAAPDAAPDAAADGGAVDAPYETCTDCVFDYTMSVQAHYVARWKKVCAAAANTTVVGNACAFCAQYSSNESTDYCASIVYAAVAPVQVSEGYCVAKGACQWNGGLSDGHRASSTVAARASAADAADAAAGAAGSRTNGIFTA